MRMRSHTVMPGMWSSHICGGIQALRDIASKHVYHNVPYACLTNPYLPVIVMHLLRVNLLIIA